MAPCGLDTGGDASFFRATAALFRAKPWQKVPSDDSLFGVTEAQSKRVPIPIPSIGLGGPPPASAKDAAKAKKSRRKAAARSHKKNP